MMRIGMVFVVWAVSAAGVANAAAKQLTIVVKGPGVVSWMTSQRARGTCGPDATCGPITLPQMGVVRFTAKPKTGAHFSYWESNCNAANPSTACIVNVAGTANAYAAWAYFYANGSLPAKVGVEGGQGSVVWTQNGGVPATCTAGAREGCGNFNVPKGTKLKFSAVPKPGWKFDRWSGTCANKNPTSPICTLTPVSAPAGFVFDALAKFVAGDPVFTLGPAEGKISWHTSGWLMTGSCAGKTTCPAAFTGGDAVTFEALPSEGFIFGGWGGVCKKPKGLVPIPECSLTAAANEEAFATFIAAALDVFVKRKLGAGTVSWVKLGAKKTEGTCGDAVQCGPLKFPWGATVVLTATPAKGFKFQKWEGPCRTVSAATHQCVTEIKAQNIYQSLGFTVFFEPK